MENRFYVYAHFIPNEDLPFYIGKGTADRAYQKWNRSPWWKRIVNKHGLEVRLLQEGLTHEQANELEIELIAKYGRRNINTGCLINLTGGGEGFVGMVITEEHRRKNSEAIKSLGENHPAKREEWREYMRTHNPSFLPEVKEKISKNSAMKRPEIVAKLKGRKHTVETKKKISEANRKRIRTEESKEKVRQSLLRYHKNKGNNQ